MEDLQHPTPRLLLWRVVLMQVLCTLAASAQADNDYAVIPLHEGSPGLQIVLTLDPEYNFELRKLAPRGADWEGGGRVPHCDGDFALEQDEYGNWLVPPGCRQVTWSLKTPMVADGAFDVSTQVSVFSPQTQCTLLSESTSLLRVVNGSTEHDTLRSGSSRWRIPSREQPRQWYAICGL